MTEEQEKILIEKCIKQDRVAQEKLYREYADHMFSICLIYTDNEDEACDVLQDGFIKVFKNISKFRRESNLGGWIRRIFINEALTLYRKKKRKREVLEEYKGTLEPNVQNIIEKINATELVKMVNALPSKASMVIKLYAIEGYKHKEIAELLGISIGTSKSQLSRARVMLKEMMAKENG